MKRIIVFLLLVFCGTYSLEAATLHAVLIADTTDPTVGPSTESDLANMRAEMKKVCNYTGLTLKETVIQGKRTVPRNVFSAIDKLKIDPDDVIFFYFSGHGYRTPSKEGCPWPNLFFNQVWVGIDYEQIENQLEGLKPRLLLMISDVCNSLMPEEHAPPLVQKLFFSRSDATVKKNYCALFLNAKGVVLITSSTAGEPSWGGSEGGLYTTAFLKQMSDAVQSSEEANWSAILDRTATDVQPVQNPDFLIDLYTKDFNVLKLENQI